MADKGNDPRLIPGTWVHSDRFVPRAFVQPTLRFIRMEAASGILMLVAAIVAIAWANSPAQDSYFRLFETTVDFGISAPSDSELDDETGLPVDSDQAGDLGVEDESAALVLTGTRPASPDLTGPVAAESGDHGGSVIKIGPLELSHLTHLSIRDWINDALMALFFFVVGLEIKRELIVGELRDPKAAAFPAIAAIGGMVVPAGIYLALNAGGEGANAWGIPMATDIAFAVGVLSMVGRRVPVAAKLFLLALAIVDDLGAILVIAVVYTEELFFDWLGLAILGLFVVWLMQKVHVRSTAAYVAVGVLVWIAVLESGVHATIAGVALALLTPVRAYFAPEKFAERAGALVDRAREYIPADKPLHTADHHTLERVQSIMGDLRTLSRESVPPLTRMELALVPWTSYVIVPLFALANAGVILSSDMFADVLGDSVLVGIFLGLVVGKLVGVVAFGWIAVKTGLGKMPRGVTWSHIIGVALLAGIGFTVALFVAALSFPDGGALADSAKVGIFAASLVAGLGGFAWLRFVSTDASPTPAGVGPGSTDH